MRLDTNQRSLPTLVAIVALFVIATTAGAQGQPVRSAGIIEPRAVPVPADPGLSLGELIEGDLPFENLPPDILPAAPATQPTGPIRLPHDLSYRFHGYPDPEAIELFLAELANRYERLVDVFPIGTSWQGRTILAARLTNKDAPQPIADRPAMYIDGQHHAREIVSNAVALYTLWSLADLYGSDAKVTHLLDTRVLYVVPSVNVDGNAIALADYQEMRKNANPTATDDDGDGLFDEDYSEGYGYGTHTLYHYIFDQEWADENPENPFIGAWRSRLVEDPVYLGRFTGVHDETEEFIPRFDRDGDGLQDEDEIGGVDPNRNYAAHWDGGDTRRISGSYRGEAVWSEPEVRAVRDLVLQIPTLATALSYHSGTDLILHPWGWSDSAALPDAQTFELIGRKGTQLTEVHGFPGSPHTWTARGLYNATGSTMDYLYETLGVIAFSPEVYGSNTVTRIERAAATGTFTVGVSTGAAFNPDPADVPLTVDRWNRFAWYLLAATPNIELHHVAVEGGDLVVHIGNDGFLPVAVTAALSWPTGQIDLEAQTLRAGIGVWRVPAKDLPDTFRLDATAELLVGTNAHVVENLAVQLKLEPDGESSGNTLVAVATEGTLRPWVDLGTWLGGWLAPEGWDEAGRHHRGPPIPVDELYLPTPDVTPHAGARATPAPTRGPRHWTAWLPLAWHSTER